jgi:hypothetical protein
MTKKGPLGKAEEYYVKGHYTSVEAKQIAKELDRPIGVIKKHIEKVKSEEATGATAGKMMARQDGIVVMTESSSTMADETKKTEDRRPSCTTSTKQ